jgi:hypothetical protein
LHENAKDIMRKTIALVQKALGSKCIFTMLAIEIYPCGGGRWAIKSANCAPLGLSALRT